MEYTFTAFAAKYIEVGDGSAVKERGSSTTLRFMYGFRDAQTGRIAAVVHSSYSGQKVEEGLPAGVQVQAIKLNRNFEVFGERLDAIKIFDDVEEALVYLGSDLLS